MHQFITMEALGVQIAGMIFQTRSGACLKKLLIYSEIPCQTGACLTEDFNLHV